MPHQIKLTFDIKCTRKGLAVTRPPSTVSHKILGLVRCRCLRIGDRKVVCSPNEAVLISSVILLSKVGVLVVYLIVVSS